MPTVQVNDTQPIRFEAGGIIRLNDGVDDLIIRNKEKGTLRIQNSSYDVLAWQENGANQVPLEGDQQTPRVEIVVKASKNDTDDLWAKIIRRRRASANGLVFVFTAQIDVPDFAGATTGRRFPFTNAYVMPQDCEYQSGTEFDTTRLVFMATAMGEPTTY